MIYIAFNVFIKWNLVNLYISINLNVIIEWNLVKLYSRNVNLNIALNMLI